MLTRPRHEASPGLTTRQAWFSKTPAMSPFESKLPRLVDYCPEFRVLLVGFLPQEELGTTHCWCRLASKPSMPPPSFPAARNAFPRPAHPCTPPHATARHPPKSEWGWGAVTKNKRVTCG
jgi:hypothetical protein